MKKGEKLMADQLSLVAEKSLRNAGRLIADAELCLKAGSTGTAFALAVLGAEEVGKHIMCFRATLHLDEDADSPFWRGFRRRFRSHDDKFQNALMGLWTTLLGVAERGKTLLGEERSRQTTLIPK